MSGRSPSTATATATPTQRRQATRQAAIVAEVRAACDALKRAVAAGKQEHDDLTLQMIVDDLGVVASDLALIDRDLREHGK